MGKPNWVTKAGELGTIEEGAFYNLQLDANDPDGNALSYAIISGYLPPGLVINKTTGIVSGNPKSVYEIRGVPFDVTQDVTNTFCCRVTSSSGQISDRTFSLTVTGQDTPTILTDAQQLTAIFDGTYVSIFIRAQDLDNEPIQWSVSKGELPPGLSLNQDTGEISGYATPVTTRTSSNTVGWDAPDHRWNEYPWNNTETWINQNYQFTIEVTDGKEFAQKTYTLLVLAKSLLTADVDNLTVDENSLITADMDLLHRPVLVTQPADLGIVEHDNYFAYKFEGIDFDFDEIEFGIDSPNGLGFDSASGNGFSTDLFDQGDLSIPNGITLNRETGWLYGYISRQQLSQVEYDFAVYVYKKNNPTVKSRSVLFKLTVVNELASAIIWQTPNDLGSVNTGDISELAIESTNGIGLNVTYELQSGSALPQGLHLLDNGLIIGRPSFEYTSYDNGTTTFDENIREVGQRLAPVTFDKLYSFTIKASGPGGVVTATRTFTLLLNPVSFVPYESLYLKANPGIEDKNLFATITKNTDIIPAEDVYRVGDPYFGIPQDMRMLLLSGLTASRAEEYIAAMSANHYRKNLKFKDAKVSKAYDINQNVLYEVIYYELDDYDETAAGSVSSSINLKNKINRNITVDSARVKIDNTYSTMDGGGDNVVYPNSLTNMRNQLIKEIGLSVREVLPKWMSNRQVDGSIIGWKPVVILAYVKPGTGDRILFNLNRRTDLDQKLISFDVDRYIWDNNLSKNYNATTNGYTESNETTFDIDIPFASGTPDFTVDFALDIPFNQIHGRSTAYIDDNNGLDGLILSYENKTLIFATQEQYLLYNEPNDGWERGIVLYDDVAGLDSAGFANTELVPGYTENFIDPTVTNQRAGIWKIVRDANNNVWRLEFQQEIDLSNNVYVSNGNKYGGYLLEYDPTINFTAGKTVPSYSIKEAALKSLPTSFDETQTRFISNITTYEPPDQSDKYLVFPKENIWS